MNPGGLRKSSPVLLLPTAMCILATLLGWHWSRSLILREQQEAFHFRVNEIEVSIRQRMQAYEQVLRGGLGLMNAVPGVDRAAWRRYVEGLRVEDRYPGIQGVGFSLRIPPEDRAAHVARIQAEGFPDYALRPSGDRFEYTAIIFLEPFNSRNQRAFGYDMFSESVRRTAMIRARDSGQTTVSGKVTLVQETDADIQPGILMYLPVYRQDLSAGTPEERREALLGYVYSPFRMKDLMRGILGSYHRDIGLRVYDGADRTPEALLYESAAGGPPSAGEEEGFSRELAIDVYGRVWTLRMWGLPAFAAQADHRVPWGVLLSGMALSALVLLATLSLERTKARALSLAQKMTDGYARELAERRSAVEAEQQRSRELETLLGSLPGYAFFKDAQYRYITANDAFCAGVNRTREGIAGRTDLDFFPRTLADQYRNQDRQVLSGAVPELLVEEDRTLGGKDMFVVTRKVPVRNSQGAIVGLIGLIVDLTEKRRMEIELKEAYEEMEGRVALRTRELAEANRHLHSEILERRQALRALDQLMAAVTGILVGVDPQGLVRTWNSSAARTFGVAPEAALGRSLDELEISWDRTLVRQGMDLCLRHLEPVKVNNLRYKRQDGKDGFLILNVSPVSSGEGEGQGLLLLGEDVTGLKLLSDQLAQAQKLESIGQLAAGIAHEINTPSQYVGDSVAFLRDCFDGMRRAMDICVSCAGAGEGMDPGEHLSKVQEVAGILAEIDYAYLREEIPRAFEQIQEGIGRISTIVRAVKTFAHPGGGERQAVDINKAIESTLEVSRNEWKYVAEVSTELAPDLPLVHCLPGPLNQVLLNVIVNAAHAIADQVRGTQDKGRITVGTRLDQGVVEISVADTGTGIPVHARDKVFDPFYTTKAVGKGTGQGLALAYDIVVNKHGGSIGFETEDGRGTTFFIRLPVQGCPPGACQEGRV